MIRRRPLTVLAILQYVGILMLVPLAVGLAKRQQRPDAPTPALLERAVMQEGALEQLVSPALGLLRVEYYEGGDVQRAEHLCGDPLRSALPEIRTALKADRDEWTVAEPPLTCDNLECFYNPGEPGHYTGRYIFRWVGKRLVLSGIIRLESGAVGSDKPWRYQAAALRRWRNARCPELP